MLQFELNINGEKKQIQAKEDTPLLWVLREELQYTGTKFGCGKGLCGACTVLFNGESVRSCSLPVSAAVGTPITTIEGLNTSYSDEKNPTKCEGESTDLHPVQAAWLELNVAQCGYCQPGQIMSAVALLNKNLNPSDEDIDAAMSGNLCRCGTYPRIRAAIHLAATQIKESGAKEC